MFHWFIISLTHVSLFIDNYSFISIFYKKRNLHFNLLMILYVDLTYAHHYSNFNIKFKELSIVFDTRFCVFDDCGC